MEETRTKTDEKKKFIGSNTISGIIVVLLGITLMLTICNLGATGYLIYKSQQPTVSETASTHESLPDELTTKQGRAELYDKFQEPFNKQDNETLYELMDPLVRVEITRDQFDQQMPLLYQIAGNIDDGIYANYEYKGISNGKKVFVLYYRIQTEYGPATLVITIGQANQEPYTILGYHINSK